MRLTIVCPRFPEYGYRGDQLRARQLIELLSPDHELHVVTGGRPSDPGAVHDLRLFARVTLIRAGPLARLVATVDRLAHRQPAEVGWMAPARLRHAVRASAATSDALIASTVRVVSEPLPVPLILDHIDALSVNMRGRAELERLLPLRLAARVEAALLRRHERVTAGWAAAQIAVSEADARSLPPSPPVVVIPHAIFASVPAEGGTAAATTRDIDVIFTGNMRYPPNRDAAGWLSQEITPELRRLRPDIRVMIAGRSAHRLSLDEVEVASDVPDLAALLRRARVAIVPLRGGTGVPNKLLEAAVAGAAIVATPLAAGAAGVAALTANDASGLAAAVVGLLDSDEARSELAARARADLAARAPTVVAAQLRALLSGVVSHAGASGS